MRPPGNPVIACRAHPRLHPSWPAGTGRRDPSFILSPSHSLLETSETSGSQVGDLAESSERWADTHRYSGAKTGFQSKSDSVHSKQRQTSSPTPAQTPCRLSEGQGLGGVGAKEDQLAGGAAAQGPWGCLAPGPLGPHWVLRQDVLPGTHSLSPFCWALREVWSFTPQTRPSTPRAAFLSLRSSSQAPRPPHPHLRHGRRAWPWLPSPSGPSSGHLTCPA